MGVRTTEEGRREIRGAESGMRSASLAWQGGRQARRQVAKAAGDAARGGGVRGDGASWAHDGGDDELEGAQRRRGKRPEMAGRRERLVVGQKTRDSRRAVFFMMRTTQHSNKDDVIRPHLPNPEHQHTGRCRQPAPP